MLQNQEILKILLTQAENHRLAHAYLFLGPKESGMETVVSDFSQKFLELTHNSDLDMSTGSGQLLPSALLAHPDFLYFQINSADLKEAEQVRKFIDRIYLKPFIRKHKIVFIPQIDELNWHSGNALLKAIEEPAEHTHMFLTAHSRNVLPTIISRCQVFNFNKPRLPTSEADLGGLGNEPVLSKYVGKTLSERLNAINIFAELDDRAFIKILENFVFELAEKLATTPDLFVQLRAGMKAIEDFKTNKNKKFILQGIMLKI